MPKGLELIRPFSAPFLNSLILLGSAVSLTRVHYKFLMNLKDTFFFALTCFLGCLFLLVQLIEYNITPFGVSDSVYGGLFFFMTGFHGLHVFLGLIFLLFNFMIMGGNNLLIGHHLSFEFSIIYWHFVDVVWLYLFIFLYWWS